MSSWAGGFEDYVEGWASKNSDRVAPSVFNQMNDLAMSEDGRSLIGLNPADRKCV